MESRNYRISTLVHNSFLDWDARKLTWFLCSILQAILSFVIGAFSLLSYVSLFFNLYFSTFIVFHLEADLKSFLKGRGVHIYFN